MDELCYNGWSVNVGTFDSVEKENGKSVRKSYEVDFMATKGSETIYLQITENLSNAEVKKLEVRPYILLNDQVKKIIVVNRPIKGTKDENGFTVVGVAEFLLGLDEDK